MCEFLKALQKPFPAEDIEWRVSHAVKGQKGAKALVLAYVTNRAIMERLDEVFGIAGWKNEFQEWREKGVLCTITCKVENEWIPKSDGADVTDMEATKGGFSASMKRAAVQWGIGRYLYNLEQVWVEVKEKGQNYIRTQTKQKELIQGYWDTPRLPEWALPTGYEQKDTKPQEAHDEPENVNQASQNKPAEQQRTTQDSNRASGPQPLISDAQIRYAHKLKSDKHISDAEFDKMISEYGVTSIKELSKQSASKLINALGSYTSQESDYEDSSLKDLPF